MTDFQKMMKALDKPIKGTPTVDQVRARYIDYETEMSHCAGWIDGVSDEHGTAFDQWLNEIRAEAWDEGFDAGERDALDLDMHPDHTYTLNPHALPKAPGA